MHSAVYFNEKDQAYAGYSGCPDTLTKNIPKGHKLDEIFPSPNMAEKYITDRGFTRDPDVYKK
ncbi:hypothetical protein HOK51_09355 [Candidatus Woesearchaeota archaeon]|jgi:hypothetical protein|nr:hypothetical protein [Candidatus Woesearchaeota archaeon]MBT6520035.1 hypothetical protein [Candidatus Woesearchaeota archaeon]MBT7368618.1 hypothetical protein [Candidatus Woesearchaeota archaeon]